MWTFLLIGAFIVIHITNGNGEARFRVKPYDKINKTGSTVTFVWIFEDTNKDILRGELFSHIGGDSSLLFKVDPHTKSFKSFDDKTRVNITLAVPLTLTTVSVKMVLNNITTADTGYYSFKVLSLGKDGQSNTSNVSLYVTEKPHSMSVNNTGDITKDIGESLYVRCQVSGVPTPTVTWIKETREIAVGNGIAVLRINNITKQHEGRYTCKGKNSDGQVQSSIYIKIIYLDMHCSVLHSNGNATVFVSLKAVGAPAPVCSYNITGNDSTSTGIIDCDGGIVELTRDHYNVRLTANNSAGMEKSCQHTLNFDEGPQSGAVQKSHSSILLTLLTVFFLHQFICEPHK